MSCTLFFYVHIYFSFIYKGKTFKMNQFYNLNIKKLNNDYILFYQTKVVMDTNEHCYFCYMQCIFVRENVILNVCSTTIKHVLNQHQVLACVELHQI